MATREELADTLAGFALFADLGSPQLLSVAGLFEEVVVPDGERVLRQGLTGSGFYIILDGTADVCIDGTTRSTLHRGDFFGEVSILLSEPPTADVVATSSLELSLIARHALELAQRFNTAYHHHPVLHEEDAALRMLRRGAFRNFAKAAGALCELLGIPEPERMYPSSGQRADP